MSEEKTEEFIEGKIEYPFDVVQIGDLIIRSHKFDAQQIAEIMKELLQDKNVAKYLGIISQAQMKKLGSMFS